MQSTDHIEGTNPNISKPWQPPASSCTIKSNNKSDDDRSNGENNRHHQHPSYKTTNSNKNSNNTPSSRNRQTNNDGGNNNRNYPYDSTLGERTDQNYMDNNHLGEDSGSGSDDLDDDNARIRSKVSRSSSATKESLSLNGSQVAMFAMTIVQTIILQSFTHLLTVRAFF